MKMNAWCGESGVARVAQGLFAFFLCFGTGNFALTSPAMSAAGKPVRSSLTISEALLSEGDTLLFVNGLKSAGLWHSIVDAEVATVFALRDSALQNEGSAFLLEIVLVKSENERRLGELMAQHIFPGQRIVASEIQPANPVKNELGGCVYFEPLDNSVLKVGPQAVVTDHLPVSNGEIYYIDRLLWNRHEDGEPCSQ